MEQNLDQHIPSEEKKETTHPTVSVGHPKRVYILIRVGLGVIVLIIGIIHVRGFFSPQQTPSVLLTPTVTPTPTIPITTEYENPFDEKSNYENPFSESGEYKNPFDSGQ